MGGSVFARHHGLQGALVPQTDCAKNLQAYRKFHQARAQGKILSAHDVSEGGLLTAVSEMAFSEKAGIEIDLASLGALSPAVALFSESTGRVLIEVPADQLDALQQHFAGHAFAVIGKAVAGHQDLVVTQSGKELVRESIGSLKSTWKQRLVEFY
jgi:phosphoribosylformylglycinamidine synthase